MLRPVIVLLLAVVVGCSGVEPFEPAPFDYSDRTPITFTVNQVDILRSDVDDPANDFVEQRLAGRVGEAAQALLEARLRAGGGAGFARAVIHEASLTYKVTPPLGGIKGAFTKEFDQYEARVRVRIGIFGDDAVELRSAGTTVTRTRNIAKNANVSERERVAYGLVVDLTDDLDRALQDNIEDNLDAFLLR